MINKELLREAPERIRETLQRRAKDPSVVDTWIAQDQEYRQLKEQLDGLRAQRNAQPKGVPTPEQREVMKALADAIKDLEARERELQQAMEAVLMTMPNVLADDVPVGASEADNMVLREVGKKPRFDFPVLDHEELGVRHGWIDKESAARVSGARFVYLKGDLVLLQFALLQYTFARVMTHGFTPVLPPHLVSTEAMGAMGYLAHGGEEEIYHLRNDEMVLIGTSEQAIGPMQMDQVLEREQLPLRYVAYSPCYRREAGSYGKDTKGILRVHQFDKIEMFSFTHPSDSDAEHEQLLAIQEELVQGLGLPYRVLKLCSADTGTPSARTYDIETWIPSQETYRETHSTSTTTDYQTRRLKIRTKEDGQMLLVHALNGTAFAMGRILVALIENGQQADGRVAVPEVLRPFMGGREFIG